MIEVKPWAPKYWANPFSTIRQFMSLDKRRGELRKAQEGLELQAVIKEYNRFGWWMGGWALAVSVAIALPVALFIENRIDKYDEAVYGKELIWQMQSQDGRCFDATVSIGETGLIASIKTITERPCQ